ncbi:hypothetical protein EB796_022972 [Bugula neritina]|uniref:Uncharacterized protein n=1 Tax=Bugula neritina TaxID=10212 RepID=A0A7J7IXR9_BUGNE|nr:hypothetical protein EB796_022972 [Bugula neritina]
MDLFCGVKSWNDIQNLSNNKLLSRASGTKTCSSTKEYSRIKAFQLFNKNKPLRCNDSNSTRNNIFIGKNDTSKRQELS